MSDRERQERAEYIAGLRELADLLESNPDLALPYQGSRGDLTVMSWYAEGGARGQMAAWARAIPGQKEKGVRGDFFDLNLKLCGLRIQVTALRENVCERVVVGTREVTTEEPDPEALAALPKRSVTTTEEIVEWRCPPILAASDSAA